MGITMAKDKAKIEKNLPELQTRLLEWYKIAFRPLPWRMNRDPYRIWISEVMLQQTTVQAVLPYYERFLKQFPKLENLAQASIDEVYSLWAGLGYYSRARNLHKASQLLQTDGFSQTAAGLIKLPGFGPYTARAVSSLAFGEKVGVLDGNVIRVLTRLFGDKIEWWKNSERQQLQQKADLFAQHETPHLINQALMELGATICTPKNPDCQHCPWQPHCIANKKKWTQLLPMAKPKEKFEHWEWQPCLFQKNRKLALIENLSAPFLKKHWIFPGKFVQLQKKPENYDFRHSITKYNIYVRLKSKSLSQLSLKKNLTKWVKPEDIKKVNPSSLLQKILTHTKTKEILSLILLFVPFLLSSCSSKSVLSNQLTIQGPDQLLGIGARPLTFLGQNYSPQFNSSGDRILFVSRNRPQHKNSQAYELNFQKVSERRVTFQDGDVSNPSYFKFNEILYSSTTDEIKESMVTREELSQSTNRIEIYSSDLFGNDIIRWTKSPGLDGDPNNKGKGNQTEIYFFSESRQPAGIYFLSSPLQSPKLFYSQGKNIISQIKTNPAKNDVVWIEKDALNKTQSLRLKNSIKSNIQELFTTRGELQNMSWGPEPDQWLISEKPEGAQDYRIILYDSKNLCTQVLATSPGQSFLDPIINDNSPRLLVFTLLKGESSHIYMMEWPKDRGPCLESKKQVKL